MFLRTSGVYGRVQSPQTFGRRAAGAVAGVYVLSSDEFEGKR